MFHKFEAKAMIAVFMISLSITLVMLLTFFVKGWKNKKNTKAFAFPFILYVIFFFLFITLPRLFLETVDNRLLLIIMSIISIILLSLSIIILKQIKRFTTVDDYSVLIIMNMLIGFLYYFFISAWIVYYKFVPCTDINRPLNCLDGLLVPAPLSHNYGESLDQEKFVRRCVFNLPFRPHDESWLQAIRENINSFELHQSIPKEKENKMKEAALVAIQAEYDKIERGDEETPDSFEKEVCKQYYLLSKESKEAYDRYALSQYAEKSKKKSDIKAFWTNLSTSL